MSPRIHQLFRLLKYFKFSVTFLARLKIIGNGKFRLETASVGPRYFLTLFALSSMMVTSVVWTIISDNEKRTVTTYIKLFRIGVALRCFMLSFTQRENLTKYFNHMIEMDVHIEKQGHTFSYKSIIVTIIVNILLISVIIVGNMLLCLGFSGSLPKCIIHFGAYNIPYFVGAIIFLHYSICTLIIWDRISILNGMLTNIVVKARRVDKESAESYSEIRGRLQSLSGIYSDIFKGTRYVNDIYSEQLSLMISRTVVEILNSLHIFMKSNNHLLAYYNMFWAATAVIEMIMVVPLCSSAVRKAKRTAQILNMMTANNADVEFEKSMFLLQMKHQKIKFVAGGCIPMDETILMNLIQTASSYFIVLLQFDSNSK